MESGIYFDSPQPRPRSARKVIGWSLIGMVAVAAVIGAFLPAPYVIEAPGPVFNVLGNEGKLPIISVTDAKTYPTDGALDLLTVSLYGDPSNRPSWGEIALAALNPAEAITPIDVMFPPQVSSGKVEQANTAMMTDSQEAATAVALKALGYRYSYRVMVAEVEKNTPSAGILKAGDEIVTVNNVAVTGFNQLLKVVQKAKGTAIEVTVLRSGVEKTFVITPKKMKNIWRLGVLVGTKFHFPIKVQLSLDGVGGPSGGTMFALGIYDKLTPGSLTGGQLIAGTGTIDENGKVGEIGGIQQKMFGAVRGGAKWFLAPAANCSEVVGHVPAGLTVVKMSNFGEALAAVRQIATKHNATGLATCTK